jgi:hypothetical protein
MNEYHQDSSFIVKDRKHKLTVTFLLSSVTMYILVTWTKKNVQSYSPMATYVAL